MPVESDLEDCVMHAGSDTIHKLPVERQLASGRTLVNRSRTVCGALTTHMYDVEPERVLELPESCRCELCFS